MQLDELIGVVEKSRKCLTGECPGNVECKQCEHYVANDKLKEMYADIQMILKQEKLIRSRNIMEEIKKGVQNADR